MPIHTSLVKRQASRYGLLRVLCKGYPVLMDESSSDMSDTNMDVLFVGNAIMDVLSACDETFLSEHNIERRHEPD